MKKFFATNYEKLIFATGLLVLLVFAVLAYLTDKPALSSAKGGGGGLVVSLRSEKGVATLETENPHRLMPGQKIVIAGAEPEFFNGSFMVEAIILPEKGTDLAIGLKNGSTLEASLVQADAPKLDSGWRTVPGGLRVVGAGDRKIIPFAEIESLAGSRELTFSSSEIKEGRADGNIKVISYQTRAAPAQSDDPPASGVWSKTGPTSEDEPSYDLFTPPVIYVVDGRLTTRVPQEKEPEKPSEEFGVELSKFEKVPYRFRIRSWTGQTPVLDDLLKEHPPKSGRFVRNRLNIRVPYKENPAYKPGAPTLVPTTLDDADKLLMIEAFEIVQVRDPKTKGLRRVGRVMLKDFGLPVSFEINSNMQTTHAGQYRIAVESSLKKFAGDNHAFKENSKGSAFSLNEREYRVLEIDTNGSRVWLEKKALDPPEIQREWLSLLGDRSPSSEN